MIPTTRSDDIQDFLAFFRQMVGVEAASEREGAPARDIERFAQLARRPLPPLYLGYLAEFGRRDRVLRLADDGDARVASLLRFYDEQDGAEESEIPPNGVVIAAQGLSGGRALIFPAADAAPSVVENWWGEAGLTLAASFENFLFSRAFLRGRFPRGTHGTILERADEQDLGPARELATSLGFAPYWFGDEWQLCRERDDGVALHAVQLERRAVVYLRARAATVGQGLKSTFMQQLRLRDASPHGR